MLLGIKARTESTKAKALRSFARRQTASRVAAKSS
jgi:hypothetical protein